MKPAIRNIILLLALLTIKDKIKAQDDIDTIVFSLSSKNITVSKLFRQINEQTGMQFAYSDKLFSKNAEIELNKKDSLKISEILNILRVNLNIDYKIVGDNICLVQKANDQEIIENSQINKSKPCLPGKNMIKQDEGVTGMVFIGPKQYKLDNLNSGEIHIYIKDKSLFYDSIMNKPFEDGSINKKINFWISTGLDYYYIRHNVTDVNKQFPTYGFHLGIKGDKNINRRFALSAFFGYIYRSSKNRYTNDMPVPGEIGELEWKQKGFILDVDNLLSVSHHYIDISFLLRYNPIKSVELNLGPGYYYCLTVNKDIDRLGINYLKDLYGHHYKLILGTSCSLSKKIRINLDYNYGLKKLFDFSYSSDNWKIKESYFGFGIDYKL